MNFDQSKIPPAETGALSRSMLVAVLACTIMFLPARGEAQEAEMPASVVARFGTGEGPDEIGVSASTPNLMPEGPRAIAASSDGQIYVLDTLNKRIFGVDPSGGAPRGWAIEEAEYPTDLAVSQGAFYVLEAAARRVLIYNEQGRLTDVHPIPPDIQLAGSVSLAVAGPDDIRIQSSSVEVKLAGGRRDRSGAPSAQLATPTPAGIVESRFERDADDRGVLEFGAGIGGERTRGESPSLEIDASEYLASAELLAVDTQGRLYVLVEELATGESEFDVQTSVRRYSPAGELEAVAQVPLASVDFLANRYLTVGPEGEAYFLQSQAEQVRILRLSFDDPTAGRTRGEPPPRPSEDRSEPGPAPEGFEDAVRKAYPEPERKRRSSGITRQRILENAESYLSVEWLLRPENDTVAGVPSECLPPQGRIWQRPDRLEAGANLQVAAVPYKWGGYDSLPGFVAKLEQGYLAGDICTCRDSSYDYCITGNSTGVDCSGFVSRTWEEGYYTTSSLDKIADPLSDWRTLRAGDIVNRPGSHVRLVTGISEEGPLIIHTIESAKSRGGVCRASYRVSQLQKYIPMRYRLIRE
jgi:cell wall-associated NlpC family hydrolase